MIELYLLLFGLGTGVFVVLLLFLQKLRPLIEPMAVRLSKLQAQEEAPKKTIQFKKINATYGAFIGLAFGLLVTWGNISPTLLLVFMIIGLGFNIFIKNSIRKTDESRLRLEIAILYEVVDFYTSAGYSLQQSLQLGASVLPRLNPIVDRVLSAWPQGPQRALQILADEIPIQEAETLAMMLTYIFEAGSEQGRAAIEEEARHLEMVRKTMSEIAIINKPLFYSVYRVLPVAALGGIVVGPLLFRISTLLQILAF